MRWIQTWVFWNTRKISESISKIKNQKYYSTIRSWEWHCQVYLDKISLLLDKPAHKIRIDPRNVGEEGKRNIINIKYNQDNNTFNLEYILE